MKIDIATKVLGDEEDVYIVRPGEGYWAFDQMRKSSRIFLDFPDLKITPGGAFPSDERVRLHLVRSMTLREWYDDDKVGPKPSNDIKDFDDKAYRRRLGRYSGALKRLMFDLTPGTIIVMPDEGYYGRVYIGEIAGPAHLHSWNSIYEGEELVCRRVKWARWKARGEFSEEIRDLLGHTTPILQLPRSLRPEILRAGYDQYAYSDAFSARLNTEEEEFNTLDDLSIQQFLNYVTGVLIAVELGESEKIDYKRAIRYVRENPHRAMELQQNINSPGFQRLIDKTVAPLAVAALLTLAIGASDPSAIMAADTAIELVNSKAANHDCVIDVAERVAGARDLMMIDDWERLCAEISDVKDSTGISTTMKLHDNDG